MADQAYTKKLLSGSTNGKSIKIVATSSTGTTLHTAVSGTSSLDEVWLWFQNNDTANRVLTIEFGATSTDNNIIITLPPKSGLVLVVPGLLLQNALVITAFADAANVVEAYGYVNAIV